MKALFEWHALEEIEHRSVAFDVLQSVDKSYLRRAAGLMSAYLILSGLTGYVTANLLWQDKVLLKKHTIREGLNVFILEHALLPKAMGIFARYLRPGFHPGEQNHLEALIKKIFPDDVPGVA
jgi:predicted metal-dependent hydrolase